MKEIVGFEVLTAVSTKMAVFYQTTWRYNPEDSHLHMKEISYTYKFRC
jgi:hypothetical protein